MDFDRQVAGKLSLQGTHTLRWVFLYNGVIALVVAHAAVSIQTLKDANSDPSETFKYELVSNLDSAGIILFRKDRSLYRSPGKIYV